MKTSIVIPYKNRAEFLGVLLEHLPKYLRDNNSQLDYNIVVAEQLDDVAFNRSLSVNIAIKYAIDVLHSEHIIVHDVDIIPVSNINYSYRNFCMCWFVSAGGLNCLSSDLIKINGYCNSYYGWGNEDVDVIKRLTFYNIKIHEWKEFAVNEKPTLVNMEWSGACNSNKDSKSYWGCEWPRFLNPSEHNLPSIVVNKREHWYEKRYVKLNKKKLEMYSSLSFEQRNEHYQSSGLNQVTLNNISATFKNDNVFYLQYKARDMHNRARDMNFSFY
jgi:glycosyltransferase involved in cell wall biosynthesis